MEKIGFISELLAHVVANRKSLQDVHESSAWEGYVLGLASMQSLFRSFESSSDIELLISAEELYLIRERDIYGAEDPTVLPSLNAALADFKVIKSSLQTVREPVHYKKAATTYHDKENGKA